MPISNYAALRPQLTITQVLAIVSSTLPRRLYPLVIGPHYRLNRYGTADVIPAGTGFLSAGQTLPYMYMLNGVPTAIPGTDVVDVRPTSPCPVSIYASGLEATLTGTTFQISSDSFYLTTLANPMVIQLAGSGVAGSELNTGFHGRPVTIGDIVYVDDGTTIRRRTVTGLVGQNVAATYAATPTNSGTNPVTHAVSSGATGDLVVSSSPGGMTVTVTDNVSTSFTGGAQGARVGSYFGESYIVTVANGGVPGTATVNIASADGLFSATNVATTQGASARYFDITSPALAGVTIQLDSGSTATPLTANQVFAFQFFKSYTQLGTQQLVVADYGSGYTGAQSTNYIIQVLTGTTGNTATGGVVRISDSAGVDSVQNNVTLTNGTAVALGSLGLKVTFDLATHTVPQGGLRAGDIYVVAASAAGASTTAFDKVILNAPAVDTSTFTSVGNPIGVEFRLPFSGNVPSTYASSGTAWTVDPAAGVTIEPGLALNVTTRLGGYQWVPFVNALGSLTLSFRSLIAAPTGGGLLTINTLSDITNAGLVVDMADELGYGVWRAWRGNQGNTTYALPISSFTLDGWAAAFLAASQSDSLYALAILSADQEVQVSAAAYVEAASQPTVKNFRRCYVGTDSPGQYTVVQYQSGGTNPFTATVGAINNQNVFVTFQQDPVLSALNIEAGDFAIISGVSYPIAAVLTDTELTLQNGPTNPITPAVPIVIQKANTPASQTAFVIAASQALNSRRAINVWTENGTTSVNGVPTIIPNRFLACEVAGLRCAVLPQQGLTNTEITSITACPAMYNRYQETELDAVASNGTCVVTQDLMSGNVYIRHQLTTDVSQGLLYWEDSIGVNIDYQSLLLKDLLKPMVGINNITPTSVANLREDAKELLDSLTQMPAALAATIGPSLVSYSNLFVGQNPLALDRVTLSVDCAEPVPMNGIDVVLNAEPATIVLTNTAAAA